MDASQSLIQGIIIILAVISLATLLKNFKVFKKDDSLLLSKLVLKVTLPALIFHSLAIQEFHSEFLTMAAIMAIIEIGIIMLAWLIGTLLKFRPAEKGALILVSAFGMTSFLGYPVIAQVFPDNAMAMEEAVVTSEFGVGLLLFIFGPLIAMYYGSSKVEGKVLIGSVRNFFVSPIFISLVAGAGFSFIPIDEGNDIYMAFLRFFKLIGDANMLLVTFTLGLLMEFKRINNAIVFVSIAVLLKLLVKPLFSVWLTELPQFTDMMREIVFIETALPSAILGVVFAKQYNCRPELVSIAIVVTLLLSVVTVPLLFVLFF